jgi:hypothetical protein
MMMKVMSVVSQSWTVQSIFCVTHVHSTKGAMNFTTDTCTLPSVTLHVSNPFANRMQMASIMPHDRIAIAVSGGPDSMALCILTARWWQQQQQEKGLSHSVIKEAAAGMMMPLLSNHVVGMVVDHGLRPESAMEALSVQHWLARLGEFFSLFAP